MGPIQAADEPDRGDTVLPTIEQTLWKIRYLGVRLLMMRNRTDGLAQPPLIFSKSAMLRVSS